CTFNPKENEQNVAQLLGEHPELQPCPILSHLPRVCGEDAHYINLFPHIHGTDGFFVSAVRKAE
ncbi:MAG: 16S rRNA (cytosine(967)-C(5))-methyltransferase RsmB, partial [Clostridia bacterium]|nr:16S rRNA (cytosine(967)-C(5))-methyltransferase RsmB [Clostridia bacterium]